MEGLHWKGQIIVSMRLALGLLRLLSARRVSGARIEIGCEITLFICT